MKRILITSLALSALLLPACKGGASADAVKLVPDGADFIVGAHPKVIAKSELYKKFAPEFENEADFKDAMAAFTSCDLKPLEFDAVIVGANQTGDGVVIVAGNSVGKPDKATCVIKAVQKQSGETEAAEVVKEDGKSVINFTDGRAYLVNDNMLAVATTAWQEDVSTLIDGKGKPASENSKKDLLGKVDTKKAAWFVGTVPTDLAGMAAMAGPEVTEVKSIAGSIDLSKGLALALVAGFTDDAKATAAAEKVQGLFDGFKGMIPPETKGIADTVKIEASGTDVKIGASASIADLEAAKTVAAQL